MGRSLTGVNDSGYLLPAVIALGFAISVVSLSSFTTLSQNSLTLNAQYYSQLASEAAKSGETAAIECIKVDEKDWDTGGRPKLTPQTDCHGTTVAGKPTTIVNDDNVQTTYSVQALDNPYNGTTRVITSTGTATVKTASGTGVQTYTKIIRTFGQIATPIPLLTDINSGNGHTCAVASGFAYCWGDNTYGKNGDGSIISSNTPTAVNSSGVLDSKTVTAISASQDYTCAIASGAAYCWGNNTYGMLGNNSTTNSPLAVAVIPTGALSGRTVTAISTGTSHACVIADDAAFCWGLNTNGRLGNNSQTEQHAPVAVFATGSGVLKNKTVTAIDAGATHSCAVASTKAYCWGNNTNGQLGNSSYTQSIVPVAVAASGSAVLTGKVVTAIDAGLNSTCAIADGKAYCWGNNTNGQLGNSSNTQSNVPVAVDTSGVLNGKTVTAIDVGDNYACAIADGAPYCWGSGSGGKLGNGGTSDSNVPVAVITSGVLAGKTVTAISADGANSSTCVVADSKSYCWGVNSNSTFGNGTATGSSVPMATSETWGSAGTTGYIFDKMLRF